MRKWAAGSFFVTEFLNYSILLSQISPLAGFPPSHQQPSVLTLISLVLFCSSETKALKGLTCDAHVGIFCVVLTAVTESGSERAEQSCAIPQFGSEDSGLRRSAAQQYIGIPLLALRPAG